jgi:phosphatidate cytidylyltransferase
MLGLRLLTAAVGIPLLLLVLWAGHPWLGVLVALVALLAAIEMTVLLDGAGYPVAGGVVVLLGVGAVAVAALLPVTGEWLAGTWLVVAVALAATVALSRVQPAEGLRTLLGTLGGAALVAMLSFLLLIALAARPDSAHGPLVEWLDAGRAWLLITVLAVWAADSAAYATGRLWGRGRFFNHLSPSKTWTGAISGALAAILAGALLGWFVGQPLVGAGLGAVVAFAAPIGDLVESMLKRAAGVKDSGRLFPGHGGMLDRVDALLLVAPMAWLYLVIVGVA